MGKDHTAGNSDDGRKERNTKVTDDRLDIGVGIGTQLDKVKIGASGPYFVLKLYLAGKNITVEIEKALNEHAAEGWQLKQLLPVSEYLYAVLYRDPTLAKQPSSAPSGDGSH